MPLIANQTGVHVCTGGVDLIASEGDVIMTAGGEFGYGIAGTASAPGDLELHRAYRVDLRLSAGLFLHVRGFTGQRIEITAENPQ